MASTWLLRSCMCARGARLAELKRQQAIASGIKGIGGAFTTLMQDEDIAPLFKKQGTEEDPFSKSIKAVSDNYGVQDMGDGINPITGEVMVDYFK